MSKDEIKYEINKVLDQFSDKALTELLNYLKMLKEPQFSENNFTDSLNKIFTEDHNLLLKLAK
jgi:hypothetical protein